MAISSPAYVKSRVQIVTERRGGEGSFREFVETILQRGDRLEDVVNQVARIRPVQSGSQ